MKMSEEAIGMRKGDYEILGVLGAGGMGKVYKVRNVLSDRIEAMKVLLPNAEGQKDLAARFSQEIKVLASLNHPNIAALRTALTIDNQLVMIMEYVQGTTLAARVEQGAIPCADALNYIDQALSALSYAHERQVFHRDIKPANMMLTPEGVVKLMDFGIARSGPDPGLTMTGTTVGSLAYMSPEQVKCEPVDARSDLYSVGVSLYEMVTGKRPFRSDSNFAIMEAHVKDRPKPPLELQPGFPASVSNIILMAMEKDPTRRFQSAQAFRNALHSAAADMGVAMPQAESAIASQYGAAPQDGPSTQGIRQSTPSTPVATVGGSRIAPGLSAPVTAPHSAPIPKAPANQRGNRGLYIALGALIVAGILVAAGFTVPRWLKTRASDQAGQANSQQVNSGYAPAPANVASAKVTAAAPSQSDSASSPAANATNATPASSTSPSAGNMTPVAGQLSVEKVSGNAAKRSSTSTAAGQQQAANGVALPPSSPPPDPAQVAAVEKEADQLSGREAAINASLENLQRQMSAQGLGLRGDMMASQQRMQTYMTKAQAAVQAQDVQGARRYLDLAQPEVEKLEKFLGR
jgi:serine/threonine-protein kinase